MKRWLGTLALFCSSSGLAFIYLFPTVYMYFHPNFDLQGRSPGDGFTIAFGIFFLIGALGSLITLILEWKPAGPIIKKGMKVVFVSSLLVVGVIGIVRGYYWLSSIPSWAAVIIALLAVLVFK